MKTPRRRSEFLFLLYFHLCLIIPEIFCTSHPLAAIYENTDRSQNDNHSIREQRQITFRNTFQDIPKSLHKSVFTNKSSEIFPLTKYYVILSDVQSSKLSNLLDILAKDGRIYFSPRVNVLDRIDDPSLNEITTPTNELQNTGLSGRSIDTKEPNFFPDIKVGKSLWSPKISRVPAIPDISEVLIPPTEEKFKISPRSEVKGQSTAGKPLHLGFQNRKAKTSTNSKLDNSVKKRASFNAALSSGQFDYNSIGKNDISFRPSKNISKREENSEGELTLSTYEFNQSRPDFLSFIKHRSKNLLNNSEGRIGLVENDNIALEKPRPTIGRLVDLWKKMNNRYRKRLVTPPSSLIQRKPPRKSLRSSSLPPKPDGQFNSFGESSSHNQNNVIESQQKKSLQIQAQEASQRQEKRLKSIDDFSTETNDFIVESLNEEEQFSGDEIRGRENTNYNIDDTLYSGVPKIPQTSFSCSHQPRAGYYADVEAQCQVFHVCWGRRKASFLCPAGTAFSQRLQVCAWRQHVQCNYS